MSVSVENTELTNSTAAATSEAPAAPAVAAVPTPISGPVAPAPAKEEQTFSLAPAPLPASSPWKPVSNDIPVTNINLDDLESNRKKTRTPVSSTSTKWVPMKASITVSSVNRKNANGKKKSSHGNNNNTQKSNANGSASSNASRKKKSHHSHGHPHSGEKDSNNSSQPTSNDDSSVAPASEDKSSETTSDATQATQSNEQKKQQTHRHQSQRRRHYNNTNKNGQGNTNGQHNTFNRNNGQGNNRYNRHHQHNGQHDHYSHSHQQQQQMVQLQSNFYAAQPVMMAVNNIARQLEYYLSNDNLINDTYLRSKFSKDGYVPLTLLAQFYRVVNMSFGGDVNIILAAIREVVFNESATVDIARGNLLVGGQEDPKEGESEVVHPIEPSQLDNYFIRSHDWEKWISTEFGSEIEIEKVLTGNDMDEFMMKIIQVPTQSTVVPPVSTDSSTNEQPTETAEATTEEKADGNVEENSA